jgi:Chlorophyll A-B binding protein
LLFEGDTIVSDKLRSAEKTIDPPTEPSFGWNVYAEQINGRFAMVGFVLLLGLEWFTGQDFFTWLGVR